MTRSVKTEYSTFRIPQHSRGHETQHSTLNPVPVFTTSDLYDPKFQLEPSTRQASIGKHEASRVRAEKNCSWLFDLGGIDGGRELHLHRLI